MTGKFQNLLDHQDCIPEETLLGYIEGRLSPRDANKVEQHLLDCELCSDALEGIKLLHPAKSRAITAELNARIDERTRQSIGGKVVPFFTFYRIAAILVVVALFGGGYWFLKNKVDEKSLAINQASEIIEKDSAPVQFEPAAGSAIEPASSVNQTLSSAPQKQIAVSAPNLKLDMKEEISSEDASKYEATVSRGETDDLKKAIDNQETFNDGVLSKTDTFFTGNEVAISDEAMKRSKQNEASNAIVDYQSSSQKTPEFSEEKVASQTKDKVLSEVAVTSSDRKMPDLISIYARGKSNYDQKNYIEAASDFEKVLNDTTTTFYDDAKWYLANCYMKTGRNAKARKLLQEIAASNSKHAKAAFGLLQE